MTPRRRGLVLLAILSFGVPLRAQSSHTAAASGFFSYGYWFDEGIGARAVTQWGVPAALGTRLGARMSVGLTTAWVSSSVASYAGWSRNASGLTDVRIAARYLLDHPALGVTLGVSLPAGGALSSRDRIVTGALASPLLSLPVTDPRQGPAVTMGLAAARRLFGVNVDVSGAMRWTGAHEVVNDQPSTYSPGVELRGHAAAQVRAPGGRLTAGVTVSSFTDDEFAFEGVPTRRFRPGLRALTAVAYAAPMRQYTLRLDGWMLLIGSASDTAGALTIPEERLVGLGAAVTIPAGSRTTVEPSVRRRAARRDGREQDLLWSGAMALTIAFGRLLVEGNAAYQRGFVTPEAGGEQVNLSGFGVTIGMRLGF